MSAMLLRIVWLYLLTTILIVCGRPAGAVMVVLDPGHGGRLLPPTSVYGDKFDPLTGRYQDRYREGAHEGGIWENEVMYDLAIRIRDILAATNDKNRHAQFRSLIARYGNPPEKIQPIQVALSRRESYFARYNEAKIDLNAEYRLYDYEDILTGEIKKGTISRINALAPELVVTLHLTGSDPGPNGGLAAVITPSYHTYKTAIDYIHAAATERHKIQKNFLDSPYGAWFRAQHGYNHWESFMADAWIYFTGYWPIKNGLETDFNKYRGYRQNMFSWAYRDKDGWTAQVGQSHGPYAYHLRDFRPQGPFWEREQSEAELWRRENGPEGYGGDNFFAAQEIFRYIRKGFIINKIDTPETAAPILKPYLSTWAVPTFVNAVSAYLELAHLGSQRDRYRMVHHRQVYAESIAVGIYALFYPFAVNSDTVPQMPTGRGLDFEKYRKYKKGNYFTIVAP